MYGEGEEGRLRAASAGRRIAAFIDTAGRGGVDLALRLGVPAGRIETVVDFAAAAANGTKALGTTDAGGAPALAGLARLAASGGLVVPVAATFPLARVQDAYRALADRSAHGRIVLHPQEVAAERATAAQRLRTSRRIVFMTSSPSPGVATAAIRPVQVVPSSWSSSIAARSARLIAGPSMRVSATA